MPLFEDALATAQQLAPEERLQLIRRLWETLPAEYWPERGDLDLADVRRRLATQKVSSMESVPWPIVERLLADCVHSVGSKVYSVPRRFDLATIFIITMAYSVLLAGMSVLRFPSWASLVVAGFVSLVGAGQALLFRGNRPRAASVLVGAVSYALSILVYWQYGGWRAFPTGTVFVFGIYALLFGSLLGYVAGAVVGGVFLLADFMRRRLRFLTLRRQANPQHDEAISPFDEDKGSTLNDQGPAGRVKLQSAGGDRVQPQGFGLS